MRAVLKLTRTPSEKIEGATEVKLETLLSTRTILSDDYRAGCLFQKILRDVLKWTEQVPNLNELGMNGRDGVTQNTPTSITIAFDYANTPEENSVVYLLTEDEKEVYSTSYGMMGFNRVGTLMYAVEDLTREVERMLSRISEAPSQILPRDIMMSIMGEAKENGMDYDFESFDHDIETPFIRRKMILAALSYLKTPVTKEMAAREIFGWSRVVRGDEE